jgi:magnesium-protoporphyrin IX monomethyl ester (oxidative) cyclase
MRAYQAQVGYALLKLYMLPTIKNEIPLTSRLQPAY